MKTTFTEIQKITQWWLGVILIAFMMLLMLACNYKSEKKKLDIDTIKSRELITQIVEQRKAEGDTFSCILEKSDYFFEEMPALDYYTELLKNLNIKDSDHLDRQLKLYHSFSFDEEFNFGLKIIPDSLNNKTREEAMVRRAYIDGHCPYAVVSIAKPIFNEDYTYALVMDGTGFGSYGSFYRFYNGHWKDFQSFFVGIP